MLRSLSGGSSLENDYFCLFAEEVLKCSGANMKDIAFAYQCLNGICDVRIIMSYFELEDASNDMVVTSMKRKLEKLKSNMSASLTREPEKVQKQTQVEVW